MPLVSVIIPSYNRAHLISETINSVLTQSFHDFEIIVVDDGSTDNTREVVSAFPVRYIYQKNQGLPNARNTGINMSESRYIAILDSDDCLCERSLEKRVEILEKNPEAALVYTQICTIDEQSRITGIVYPPFKRSYIKKGQKEIHDLLFGNHIPASTVMIRRCCLEKTGGFNPAFIHGQEDLEMWVRLCKEFDSAYIAEPLVKLRLHKHRMTDELGIQTIEQNHIYIIESVMKNPVLSSGISPEINRIYAYHNTFMSEVAYNRRKMGLARSYLLKSFKKHPAGIFGKLGLRWTNLFVRSLVPQPLANLMRRGAPWRK